MFQALYRGNCARAIAMRLAFVQSSMQLNASMHFELSELRAARAAREGVVVCGAIAAPGSLIAAPGSSVTAVTSVLLGEDPLTHERRRRQYGRDESSAPIPSRAAATLQRGAATERGTRGTHPNPPRRVSVLRPHSSLL